uniref:Succinate receptor 1 n=1 Tax=Scleropages formosus TaxID=113540 RepID=A0A8C9SI72_SCLFO
MLKYASNCSEVPVLLEKYYLSTMYGLEFALGVVGNLAVVLSYMLWLRQWKSIHVYLFNLAVSDLVFLCTLPHIIYSYTWNQRETSPYFCLSNRYILHMNLYSSLLFMVLVSMDRYVLLQNPLRNHFLLRCNTAIGLSTLSWLLVTMQVAPLAFFIVQDLQTQNWTHCSDFGSMSGLQTSYYLSYSLILTATGYIMPLLSLGFLSHRIARFLKTQEGIFVQRSVSFHRPLCVVLMSVLMYLLLYSPYHVMRNVYIGSRLFKDSVSPCTHDIIKSLYILSRPVAFSHSVVNPALYFFMGDQFRELLISHIWLPYRTQGTSS